jgi:hypothetical protein
MSTGFYLRSGDDNDDMDDISSDSQGSNRSSFDYRSDESDDEHCSFEVYLQPLIIHLLPIVRSITSLPLFVLLQVARRS